MKNTNEDIEQALLSNTSLDELIKKKIETEFVEEMTKKSIKKELKRITDIAKVAPEFIFSNKSVFELFNRKTGAQTLINGVQAEAMLGLQNNIREKMAKGEISAFATNDAYVKFKYIEIYE